jgi:hypothetical protein
MERSATTQKSTQNPTLQESRRKALAREDPPAAHITQPRQLVPSSRPLLCSMRIKLAHCGPFSCVVCNTIDGEVGSLLRRRQRHHRAPFPAHLRCAWSSCWYIDSSIYFHFFPKIFHWVSLGFVGLHLSNNSNVTKQRNFLL